MRSADGRFEYRDQADRPVPAGSPPADVHRFAFRCRSDSGAWCSVNLRGRGHDIPKRSWTWNGDVDRSTLAPSINCQGEECWHGYIENGVYLTTKRKPEAQQ